MSYKLQRHSQFKKKTILEMSEILPLDKMR